MKENRKNMVMEYFTKSAEASAKYIDLAFLKAHEDMVKYGMKDAYESMRVFLHHDDVNAEARKAEAEARKEEARKEEANAHVRTFHKMEAEARKAEAEARKAEAEKEWKKKEAEAEARKAEFLDYVKATFANRRGVPALEDNGSMENVSSIMVTACSVASQSIKIRRDHMTRPEVWKYLDIRLQAIKALRNSILEDGNIYQNVIPCDMGAWYDALDYMQLAITSILEENGNWDMEAWKRARRITDKAIYRATVKAMEKSTSAEGMENISSDDGVLCFHFQKQEIAEDLEEIVNIASLTDKQRLALELHINGASYTQIGEILEMKRNNAYTMVKKSISKVRSAYMEVYGIIDEDMTITAK